MFERARILFTRSNVLVSSFKGDEIMELLKNRRAVVTGGSRGLGLGLVEALVAEGAEVTVVARDRNELEALKARLGVTIVPADVTEDGIADRVLSRIRPDILALNAGAVPP